MACGHILGSRSVMYRFGVTSTLVSGLNLRKKNVKIDSLNSFPQMRLLSSN